MQSEIEEYLDELSLSWWQNYKKSISSYIILSTLEERDLWSKQIHARIFEMTKSKLSLDDKSLHRAMRRLESQGLVSHSNDRGNKTGAKRKIYSVTESGRTLLNLIREKYLINL
jgi:DNA-binding PadR family transcriptional regulator